MPINIPTATIKTGTVAAQLAARNRISRYITVLAMFAEFDPSEDNRPGDNIEWEPFRFKREFSELTSAGFIKGDLCTTVVNPKWPKDTALIAGPSITASGISKLTELCDYQWNTSTTGKVINSLIQLSWLVVGVLLGSIGAILFAAKQ